MVNRYLDSTQSIYRLVNDFNNHKNLIIAFDFDDTVFDYHKRGDSFDKPIELLKRANDLGLSLICFSRVYKKKHLNFKTEYIDQVLGLTLDAKSINKNATAYGEDNADLFKKYYNKPFFNILLDDKAGLGQACEILEEALNIIEREQVTDFIKAYQESLPKK